MLGFAWRLLACEVLEVPHPNLPETGLWLAWNEEMEKRMDGN